MIRTSGLHPTQTPLRSKAEAPGVGVAGEIMESQRNAALAEEMGQRGEPGLARILYEDLSRGVYSSRGGKVDAADVVATVGKEGTRG